MAPFAAAGALAQQAQQIQDEAAYEGDRLRLLEEKRAFDDWEASNIDDQQNGYLSRRGKNALNVENDLVKGFDRFASERRAKLATDRQRIHFDEAVQQRRSQYRTWAVKHESREMASFEDSEFAAGVESAKERALRHPDTVVTELGMLRDLTAERTRKRGLGDEAAAQFLREQETDFHARIVGRMLTDGRSTNARTYFEAVRESIDPDVAMKLEAAVREGSLRVEAQKEADAIWSSITRSTHSIWYENLLEMEKDDLERTGADNARSRAMLHDAVQRDPTLLDPRQPDLKQALAKVREIKDPDLRDLVDSRIKDRFRERELERRVQVESIYERATKRIDTNPGTNPRDLIPPHEWDALPSSTRDDLMKRAEPSPNDMPADVGAAWIRFVFATPEQRASLTPTQFGKLWVRLPTPLRRRFEEEVQQARAAVKAREEKAETTEETYTELQTPRQVALEEFRTLIGKPTGEFTADEEGRLVVFEHMAREAVRRFERETFDGKKRASTDQIREVIRQEALQSVQSHRPWEWKELLTGVAGLGLRAIRGSNVQRDWDWYEYIPVIGQGIRWGVFGTEEDRKVGSLSAEERANAFVPIAQIKPNELEQLKNLLGSHYTDDRAQRLMGAMRVRDHARVDKILAER